MPHANAKPQSANVVIIGAGPSGLTASLWLSKLGIRHTLLEASAFPRHKACADVITSNVIRVLNEVDPDLIPGMKAAGIIRPIKGTLLFSKSQNALDLKFKDLDGKNGVPSCYSVQRRAFDAYLMDEAYQTGLADIQTNCLVKEIVTLSAAQKRVLTNRGLVFETPLVIGATGSNYNISRFFQPIPKEDRHYAIGIRAYFKGVECTPDHTELILDRRLMPGGLYITPLENGLYNVNLVMRKDLLKQKSVTLKKAFEQMLEDIPWLGQKFANAELVSEFKGSGLFLGTKERQICGQGYMLAGDAAGLIDLISANGIPQAMLSGKMAAQQAAACLSAQDFSHAFMQSYQRQLFKAIRTDLSLSRLLNRPLSASWFNDTALGIFQKLAKGAGQPSSLVNLLYDKNPILSLINPAFYYRLIKGAATR